MTNTILAYLIVFVVIAALIAGIVNMIKHPKSSGFASLTAFHDLQAKDKQAGIEAVIEHQAEKENGRTGKREG